MRRENGYYGHRAALAAYAGVPAARPLVGLLQHGWQPGPGLPASAFAEPEPPLLWSQRNLDAAAESGLMGATAIGAPWLYRFGTSPLTASGRGVLAMPFHGWERQRVSGDLERYAAALAELERQGLGPVTVCMYWAEHADPALRAIFAGRGFTVVTAGPRDDNPAFLDGLRAMFADHALVTSNRVATATFYALASGRPFLLHGPVMGLDGTQDPDGNVFAAYQRATFPELCAGVCGGGAGHALGLRELGAEHVRSPGALRALLRWSAADAPYRVAAHGRRIAFTFQRRLRELMAGERPAR